MNRLNAINSLRGVAIISVILIHVSSLGIAVDNEIIRFFSILIGQFSGFAVPIFVIISGYVLSMNYLDKLNSLVGIQEFFIKRMKRILIP